MMMMMMSTAAAAGGGGVRINNMNGGSRFPFTASQWEELEHQALVYKYIISGIPIPPHLLLFTIKTSHSSSTNTIGCFEMGGFGRKIDPEPGRCRRTDGKKWRCSKEAYPDSKYCERHMHRGRNRSRKPVELVLVNNTHSKFSTRPAANVFSSQHHLLLNSSPPYRKSYYNNGMMKLEVSESSIGDSWQLAMNNINSSFSDDQNRYYSYQPQQQHQLIDDDDDGKAQKVMHHFIDEWPVPNQNQNQNENDDINNTTTTTGLSISTSTSTCARDFFLPHK